MMMGAVEVQNLIPETERVFSAPIFIAFNAIYILFSVSGLS